MTKKCGNCIHEKVCGVLFPDNCPFYCEEPKQEELTLEKAIDFLTETGWLPNHDRELTEPKQGEWIFDKDYPMLGSPYGSYKCSNCGRHTDNEADNFCPNCGAKMEVDNVR